MTEATIRVMSIALCLSTASAAFAQTNARTNFPPRVQRVLTAEERRFFGERELKAVAALNMAMGPDAGTCAPEKMGGALPNPADPAASVSEGGELSSAGIEPRPYQVWLECKSATGDHRELSINLSGSPRNLEGAEVLETKTREKTYRLHAYDFGKVALSIESASASKKTDPREVALPASLEITVHDRTRGAPEDSMLAFLRSLDRAPLLASLSEAPTPPRRPVQVLVPAVAATPQSRAEAESAIWGELINRFARKSAYDQVVVEADASGPKLGDEGRKFLLGQAPDISSDSVSDYDHMLSTSSQIPSTLTWRAPIVHFSREEQSAMFDGDGRNEGWKNFRKTYKNALALVSLSRVGFSPDLRHAIVYAGIQSDWLAGYGGLWVFERRATGWELTYEIPLWVS